MLIFIYGQKIRQGHFAILNEFDFKQKWRTFLTSTDRVAQIKFQYAFPRQFVIFRKLGWGAKIPKEFLVGQKVVMNCHKDLLAFEK